MSFSDTSSSRGFYSPAEAAALDAKHTSHEPNRSNTGMPRLSLHSTANNNTSDVLQQHNTHELLHPLTIDDEHELLTAIKHNLEQQQQQSIAVHQNKCCVCAITVSSHQNIKIEVSAKHKGQDKFRALFHLHCMPLLWQTMLTQTANKQKFALCHGTEANDDVPTKIADVPAGI